MQSALLLDKMENRIKIIKLQAGMSDPKGILIPRGVQEKLTVEIADGVATYYFKNRKVTQNFARIEIVGDKKKGLPQTTVFVERLGKAIKKYDGKKKEEIRDIILDQLKKLNCNAKVL